MIIYKAIIDIEDDQIYEDFYGWLEDNESNIEAISSNIGCGCCIDSYYIGLKNEISTTNFLSKTSSPIDMNQFHYGAEKDRMINEEI